MCDSSEFSNYGYVSVDICKKRKGWFKYRNVYCSCTDPERFVRGGPTLTKVFLVDEHAMKTNMDCASMKSFHGREIF